MSPQIFNVSGRPQKHEDFNENNRRSRDKALLNKNIKMIYQ